MTGIRQEDGSYIYGVWVYGSHDMGFKVDSIYDDELAALRVMNANGYGSVKWVPFATDFNQATR